MARQQRERHKQAARRSEQREDRRGRQRSKKRFRRWLYLGTSGVFAVLIIIALFLPSLLPSGTRGGTGATSYQEGIGVPQPVMPSAFHTDDVTVGYNTTPPTSGDHWSTPTQCGFYEEDLRDEIIVHNMEHGNVIMSHNLTDPSDIARLRDLQSNLDGSGSWLVTRPYSEIPEGEIAMTAWGVLDQFTGINEERIRSFVDAYKGNRFSGETSQIGRGIPCTTNPRMSN